MSELIATPIIKNKFWVVEDSGNKIATIQAKESGGLVYVHDEQREYFDSVNLLKKKYKIKFFTKSNSKKLIANEVYGFPIKGKSYNEVYDVVRKLPIYSKTAKSKSLYCAGYYVINYNNSWTISFCPKNITLNRYEYFGPYKSKEETIKKLERITKC